MDTYPPIVQGALRGMSEEDRLTFTSEYERRKLNVLPMLVAAFFFIHFFFYGRIGLGIVFILVMVATLGLALPWWIVEMCITGKRVRDHNETLAVNLARDMKIMTA